MTSRSRMALLLGSLVLLLVLALVVAWSWRPRGDLGPAPAVETDIGGVPTDAPPAAPPVEGHSHGSHGGPPAPALPEDLEARIAEVMEAEGLGYRIDCVPRPSSFRPAPPSELFEDTFIVAPRVQAHGGFRMEVDKPRGYRGLHDHGYTQGMVRWDVDKTPACVVSPTPTRFVVGTIPDWEPGLRAYVCKQEVQVGDDGRVEEEVEGQYSMYEDADGRLRCPVWILRDKEILRKGELSMEGEGQAGFEDWVDVEPEASPAGLDAKIEDLRAELDEALAGDGRVDRLYNARLDGLRRLMDADPRLRETFAERHARLERERDENRAEYLKNLERWLAEAEAKRESMEDTGEP